MNKRYLLIGATGQLGRQLLSDLSGDVLGLGRDQLDLSTERKLIISQLGQLLDRYQPDLIINAAAYTAVDRAQSEQALAEQVNAWFPGQLGIMAKGMPVLHFSTDYVFDGTLKRAYTESDETAPLGVYGMTKLMGELAILESHAKATVIRCSWVVGAYGQNFVKTILRLACERESLRVVDDQVGVPTPTPFVATQVNRWLESSAPLGLYHLVPTGETSWYRYALWIVETAFERPEWRDLMRLGPATLRSITSDEYPTPAKRPASSRLDTTKWRQATKQTSLAHWKEATTPVLEQILSAR